MIDTSGRIPSHAYAYRTDTANRTYTPRLSRMRGEALGENLFNRLTLRRLLKLREDQNRSVHHRLRLMHSIGPDDMNTLQFLKAFW